MHFEDFKINSKINRLKVRENDKNMEKTNAFPLTKFTKNDKVEKKRKVDLTHDSLSLLL